MTDTPLTREQVIQDAKNALHCVFLAAQEGPAKDIHDKGNAAITLLETENAALRAERDHHKWKQEQNEQEVDRLRARVEEAQQVIEQTLTSCDKRCNDLEEMNNALRLSQQTMREALEWMCKFYCDWYDGKAFHGMESSSVAYELVSKARHALAGEEG